MANWYGTARSNYFHVADMKKFEAWANDLCLEWWTDKEGRVAISPSDSSDEGSWPSSRYVEENEDTGMAGDYEDFDILDELADHLAEGEIAVLMEAGAEKKRYITGHATAVDSKGEIVAVSIYDIYELAEKKFGKRPTPAEY